MQFGLFQQSRPVFRVLESQRVELGHGAWFERVSGWLSAQHLLFDRLLTETRWKSQRRMMYNQEVDVPRLLGSPPLPLDPLIHQAKCRLDAYTGWTLDRISVALYRNGRDSVAWHGDRMAELRADCVMGILSLGSERRFLLRPVGGGRSRTVRLTGGDLMVLGGSIHQTFQHAVPKESYAGPRIAVMFRPSRRPGG